MPERGLYLLPELLGLYLSRGKLSMPLGKAQQAFDMRYTHMGALLSRYDAVQVWGDGLEVKGIGLLGSTVIWSTGDTLYADASSIRDTWGGAFHWCIAESELIATNGTQVVRTDGTNVYDLGLTPPGAPTLAEGDAGNPNGAYYYQITFVDSDGFESNYGTTSALITVSSKKIVLTNIPLGGATKDVAKRKVYRTMAGGSTTFYLVTTIEDNETTTYTDNTADGSLGAATPPSNHAAPTAASDSCCFSNRIFLVDGSRVQYSLLPPNHKAFPSTYYHDFPFTVRAVRSLGSNVIVLTDGGPFIFLYTDDVQSMRVDKLKSTVPITSGTSAVELVGLVAWQGWRDIWATDGKVVFKLAPELYDFITGASNSSACALGNKYVLLDPEFSFRIAANPLGVGCTVRVWSPGTEENFSFLGAELELGTLVQLNVGGYSSGIFTNSEFGAIARVVYDGFGAEHNVEYGIVGAVTLDDIYQSSDLEVGLIVRVTDDRAGEPTDHSISFSEEVGIVTRIVTTCPGNAIIVDLERETVGMSGLRIAQTEPGKEERECYVYRLNANCAVEYADTLYFGTTDGVYALHGDEAALKWRGGSLHLDHPGVYKRVTNISLMARGTFTFNLYIEGETTPVFTSSYDSSTFGKWTMETNLAVWGVTFEPEFEGIGRLEPPVRFEFDIGRAM